jgi:hypothetical protein
MRYLRSHWQWTTSLKSRPPPNNGMVPPTSRSGDDGPIQNVLTKKVDLEDDDYWGMDNMGDDGGWGNDNVEDNWGIGSGNAPDGAGLLMDDLPLTKP